MSKFLNNDIIIAIAMLKRMHEMEKTSEIEENRFVEMFGFIPSRETCEKIDEIILNRGFFVKDVNPEEIAKYFNSLSEDLQQKICDYNSQKLELLIKSALDLFDLY